MSQKPTNVPGGQNPPASGNGNNPPNPDPNNQNPPDGNTPPDKPETVSYDTHRRLLDEKKKVQLERDALRAEKEERERKEAEAKGDFQKIIEDERKAREAAEQRANELDSKFVTARKMSAILKALDNAVDEKYFDFLPLEQIQYDAETGTVNAASVAQVAETFRKTYPEILRLPNAPKFPADAPNGKPNTINESEYKKLKYSEMQKWKYDQIIWGK